MSKFKPYQKDQPILFPSAIDDYVPEAHLARIVDQVVEDLDTGNIEKKYSELGQNTYHPKILIKLLFYGYSTGERSGRKITQRIEVDTAYMYLGQMYKPDFRTINDFRKQHLKELSGYFVDIVRYCKDLGMVQIGQINIDGTKIKANAANRLSKKKEQYEQWLERIDQKIKKMLEEAADIDTQEDKLYGDKRGDELPEAINTAQKLKEKIKKISRKFKDPDQKINLTDSDAPSIKGQGTSYNCQTAVTKDQIIVGTDVLTDANDKQALEPTIEATEQSLNEDVKCVAADSGYASFENYEYLSKNGKQGYIPDQDFTRLRNNKLGKYHYEQFVYDPSQDNYLCPEGHILNYSRMKNDQGRQYKIYKTQACFQCPVKTQCTKYDQRTISREIRRSLVEQMRERLWTKVGQQQYAQRLYTSEPVFGHLKHILGYRQFLLRGLDKVKAEFKLMCIGHNLKKIFRSLDVLSTC